MQDAEVVVIGAGVAGLTAAALAARSGARVKIFERHTVVGGCASFYQRQGYRFDVGATVAGGFGEHGIHARIFRLLGCELAAQRVDPAMIVHLPDMRVVRYGDERWRAERMRAFGPGAEGFWRRQERTATLAWDFAGRFPDLPRDRTGLRALLGALRPRTLALPLRLGRSVAAYLPDNARLRRFVDAQLLITAQAGAAETDWLYGATALDLAREGVYHLEGGIAAISELLARALRRLGGEIAYGAAVTAIRLEHGRVAGITLADGRKIAARHVVAAVPAGNVLELLPPGAAPRLQAATARRRTGYGAFTAYVGLPAGIVPPEIVTHHQFVRDITGPMGEGRTAFLSFSTPGDRKRARNGGTAVTISTHTAVPRWEQVFGDGTYGDEKMRLGALLLEALDAIVPGAAAAAEVVEFATPHTFERYTGRLRGFVGGNPQAPWEANVFGAGRVSGIAGLQLCGDTVFPGQSTVGAALSGANAARACGATLPG